MSDKYNKFINMLVDCILLMPILFFIAIKYILKSMIIVVKAVYATACEVVEQIRRVERIWVSALEKK